MTDKKRENDSTAITLAEAEGKQSQAPAPAAKGANPESTQAATPSAGGKGLAVFALLVAVGAGAGSGYLWYRWDKENKAQLSESAALDARLGKALAQVAQQRDAELKTFKEQLASQQGDAQSLKGAAQALQKDLTSLQTNIRALQSDIQTLQGGVEIEKGAIEIQKSDTRTLQTDIRTVQTTIQTLQGSLQALKDETETQKGDAQIRTSQLQALQEQAQALQGNFQTLTERFDALAKEQHGQAAALSKRVDGLQITEGNLAATLDNVKIIASRGGDLNALPLSEVEYLLRMADNKLKFQQDVKGAAEVLTIAGQRLAGIDEKAFQGVQAMIAENIASLRAVELPDRSALAHKIVEMERRLDGLPLRNDVQMATIKEKVKPHLNETVVAKESQQPWWEQAGAAVWMQLKDIVVVRNERISDIPLIAVKEEYFLFQNIRLELESMRLALLSNDAVSFQESNEIARKWLQTYFNTDDAGVAELLTELKTLQTLKFNPYIPDISGTLRTFQEVMERRQPIRSVNPPPAAKGAGGTPAKEAQQ